MSVRSLMYNLDIVMYGLTMMVEASTIIALISAIASGILQGIRVYTELTEKKKQEVR